MLEMPFGCSICKKSFAKVASLSKHVELCHSRKKPKIRLKQPKVITNTETIQAKVEKETKPNDKIQKVHEAEKHNFYFNNSKEHYNENGIPKNSNQCISKEMEEKESTDGETEQAETEGQTQVSPAIILITRGAPEGGILQS